jgi:AraC-like DNA-binding protein
VEEGHVRLAYREGPPSEALVPYVKRFYQLRAVPGREVGRSGGLDPADPLLRRIFPNGDANLVFDLGPGRGFSSPARPTRSHGRRALALGVLPDPVPVSLSAGVDLFGVAFGVARAYPFLPVPASGLAGAIVGLAELWGETTRDVETALERAPTFEERVATLEGALLRRRPDRPPRDADLQAVLEHVRSVGGRVRVRSLASGAGLSRQRFTRWFGDAVGLAPKRFVRLSRLHSLLDRVLGGPVEDWSRLAMRLGYYDQAHMISDFRWLTGSSPARFVAVRHAGGRV